MEPSGFGSRSESPKESPLWAKSRTPPTASTVHGPTGCDTPNSGLKAHRFDPRLTSSAGSYCPVGAMTGRLAPSVVDGKRRIDEDIAGLRNIQMYVCDATAHA